MAIRPVTPVSFRNNYSQTNFEGKKKSDGEHKFFVTSPLKAVPLAALIAMSPIGANSKDFGKYDSANSIEMFEPKSNQASGEEMIGNVLVPQGMGLPGVSGIFFFDTDGNTSDIEKVILNTSINEGKVIRQTDLTKGFLVKRRIHIDQENKVDTLFYTIGDMVQKKRKSDGTTEERRFVGRRPISSKLYHFIMDTVGNQLPVKFETVNMTKQDEIDEENAFDEIMHPYF